MRVAVTGASGFVGRATCGALRAAGHEVTALVRQGTAPAGTREVRVADLGESALSAAFEQAEAVVHLAARVHVMQETEADPLAAFHRVNVAGTCAAARAALTVGARRLVYLSSVKVHGEGRATPYRESDAPSPVDAYGRSKLEAERALAELAAADGGLEVVVLRPPLVYGPGVGGNFRRLLRLAQLAQRWPLPLGGLRNRRSLVSVGNLADAIRFALVTPGAGGRTLLVSDGDDLSTSDLLARLARALGAEARLLDWPTSLLGALAVAAGRRAEAERLLHSLTVDSSALRVGLGWRPPQSVDQAFAETARWWCEAVTCA